MGDINNIFSMGRQDMLSALQMQQMIKGSPLGNLAQFQIPPSAGQMPNADLQQVQSFNPQDSLAFSNPSVLNLQNSPFANNANMTSFFTNFSISNFQNQMMQNLALNNQKIKQQSEARLNQASTDLNSARGEFQGLQNQVSQLESEIQNLQDQQAGLEEGRVFTLNSYTIGQKEEQLKGLKGKLAQADQKVKILGMRYNQFSIQLYKFRRRRRNFRTITS
ncbi:MAG: hypothetical protein HYU63_08100 [Armatimonadetes bacterium]|nr:hypothetical protein [Armatimonadota bacterium]